MTTPVEKPSNLNVPNALTALRMAAVPVFGWVLLAYPHDPGLRWVAALIFVLASSRRAFSSALAGSDLRISSYTSTAPSKSPSLSSPKDCRK